ncbi:DUF3427 domain-containing protein [Propionibacterium freudenreichii]|uniref:DUF3427 domain-containing protein n=1 Tax=Propionibacterium freudenreichii TaxID=1744 RepID=UPI000542B0A8|nr:DEAD/DEAH box helicase [Propionibacterium freudenreichii]CEH00961.1 Putative carboxylic ester hydrolase [Propionibacterium freudenreichii]
MADDPNNDMAPGLYETPLTEELQARVERTGLQATSKPIPAERRDAALSGSVQRTLREHLNALPEAPHKAVYTTNELLRQIAGPSAQLVTDSSGDPMELQSLTDGRPRYATRPLTPLNESTLITNARRDESLAQALNLELATADRVDLLCAFVKWSGIQSIMDTLAMLHEQGVPVRLLTTTYMGATDATAIHRLADELGFQVKVNYNTGTTRLHAKSWMIYRNSGFHTAFIGSSNLSHAAMVDGLEWNVRVSAVNEPALFSKLGTAFDTYWDDPKFEPYLPDRDDERLATSLKQAVAQPGRHFDAAFLDIQPQPHQRIMLDDLAHERQQDFHRNLVVAATGTGKTVLAALDYLRLCGDKPGSLSLLFVAHRKEILEQARSTYAHVLNDANFGELLVGGEHPTEHRHVFASVQSLSRMNLDALDPTAFDVMVIDEFHHAEAATYRRILDHFQPRELLGLTATPERADGVNVASFFGDRIASELRLWDALDGDLLAPFHYFVQWDDTDLRGVKASGGEYQAGELSRLYTDNDGRSRLVLAAMRHRILDPTRMKALAFCVSVEHAHYMADVLSQAGVPSVALSGQSSREIREAAIRDLREGRLACLCTVDLFNEGIDIPSIDTVIMLRPTQSATIFLQQLGRGLRRAPGKSVLTVLDFVGHQREDFSFEPRLRALTGQGRKQLVDSVEKGFSELPAGCEIQFDKMSQKEVLKNVKRQLATTTLRLVNEFADYARRSASPTEYSLRRFLAESGLTLGSIFGRSKFRGEPVEMTFIRHRAGLATTIDVSPTGAYLRGRVRNFAHVDDPARAQAYVALSSPQGPQWDNLGPMQRIAAEMLFYSVWPKGRDQDDQLIGSIRDGLDVLRAHGWFSDELREVMESSVDASRAVFERPGGNLAGTPLVVHGTYRREELLAAIGVGRADGDARMPGDVREGVVWVESTGIGALSVQLEKDSDTFTDSTMYADYAINDTLFHWQSQSATTPGSSSGRRLLGEHAQSFDLALFVRQRGNDDLGKGAPYTFLGLVDLVSYSGSKPISITWRLRRPMPQGLYLAARAAAT